MTIDLKWALPFVLPFAILLTSRLLFFVAGAEWDGAAGAALSGVVGAFAGLQFAADMQERGARWNITIGGRND